MSELVTAPGRLVPLNRHWYRNGPRVAATLKVAEAISDATTAAQEAWQVLSAHGLL